jgi:hypothetical protein
MRLNYRTIFLIFGLVAIVVMLLSFDISYEELWGNLRRAGYYLPSILVLWLFIYMVNALSWNLIIRSSGATDLPSYWRVLKYTISGFAFNYVTPVGLMGGEPYRIMELKPYLGVERATSSVVLYVMMHIFSHFIFWLSSVVLFVVLFDVSVEMGILLGVIALFCLIVGLLFVKGYRHGMAVACVQLCSHIPLLKRHAQRFTEKHREQLENIDSQIALLHKQKKSTFYLSLGLEFVARVMGCLEVWLILNVLTTDVSFLNCILVVAFSSLMANLLFFMPMQIGGREGGFALAVSGLSLSGAYGVYAALLTRVRELFWIIIGIMIVKLWNRKR